MSRWPDLRRLFALGVLIVGAFGFSATAIADSPPDTTAPDGILAIDDGSGFTSDPMLTLHVPATDDVGVVSVEVIQDGVPQGPLPYADPISYALNPDTGDHGYAITVVWRDAAGNARWSDPTSVTLDRQGPVISQINLPVDPDQGDATLPVGVPVIDGSPIASLRFSVDGATWSPPIPWAPVVDYHFLDPSQGGSSRLGPRTLYMQAFDEVGNASNVIHTAVDITVRAPITVSPDVPATGHTITLTPQYPGPVSFPSGTHCWWEVAWGDDQSLYYGNRDQTWGFFAIFGPASGGYCKPLSFTLPWMPYRQVMVHYEVQAGTDGTGVVDEWIGASPDDPAIVPVIDSTSRSITSSSIPLVYVLPDDYVLVLGRPTTYRAYPVAGARITSTDVWSADYLDHPLIKTGGTSFTFTPTVTGDLTVCWGTDSTKSTRWSACYDPPVKRPDLYRPNTTAPLERVGTGTVASAVPVTLTWTGTDIGWGIARYQLERSVDGGSWHRLLSANVKTYSQSLSTGHSYRYRVRAIDKYGNVGYWDYGPAFRPASYGDGTRLAAYGPSWTVVPDATALGGAVHATDTTGARMTFTFTGRDVAWVAARGMTHGRARVYVDGTLVTTVDLYASADSPRRVVFRRHWTSAGTHALRILVEGTLGRPTVDVDGFLVLR